MALAEIFCDKDIAFTTKCSEIGENVIQRLSFDHSHVKLDCKVECLGGTTDLKIDGKLFLIDIMEFENNRHIINSNAKVNDKTNNKSIWNYFKEIVKNLLNSDLMEFVLQIKNFLILIGILLFFYLVFCIIIKLKFVFRLYKYLLKFVIIFMFFEGGGCSNTSCCNTSLIQKNSEISQIFCIKISRKITVKEKSSEITLLKSLNFISPLMFTYIQYIEFNIDKVQIDKFLKYKNFMLIYESFQINISAKKMVCKKFLWLVRKNIEEFWINEKGIDSLINIFSSQLFKRKILNYFYSYYFYIHSTMFLFYIFIKIGLFSKPKYLLKIFFLKFFSSKSMPPKPIPAPQKVIKGGKGIKLSDNAISEESEDSDLSDSEVTVEYESENSEHLNITSNVNKSPSVEKEIAQKEKSTSKFIEKEIIKRSCTNCKNKGFSADTYNSHISSNKNCPCKSLQSPEIVSSRPDIYNNLNKEKTVKEIDQKIEKFL
uniref:Phlebovirus glycoprotein G2 C-terminal domain-containing protein n=2 Tax=Meloidogyne TaxID=189290 RepID=A0A6V7VQ46_MELEN|nr:unnamed protein product [Meloidogyne enterolobii]